MNKLRMSRNSRLIEEMVLQTLKRGSRKTVVNALLNDGRAKAYVNEDVATKFRLKGPAQQLQVNVLNGRNEALEKYLFKWD